MNYDQNAGTLALDPFRPDMLIRPVRVEMKDDVVSIFDSAVGWTEIQEPDQAKRMTLARICERLMPANGRCPYTGLLLA